MEYPLISIVSILNHDNMTLKDKALMGFYLLQAPRRVDDVASIIIGNNDDPDKNSLILDADNKPISILYRKFKNKNNKDDINITLSTQLQDLLKDYIEQEKLKVGDYLFSTLKGTPHKNLSEVITKTFKKYFEKPVSVNTLRHSYISKFLKKNRSTNEKSQLAKLMGNGIEIQSQYNKIDL